MAVVIFVQTVALEHRIKAASGAFGVAFLYDPFYQHPTFNWRAARPQIQWRGVTTRPVAIFVRNTDAPRSCRYLRC